MLYIFNGLRLLDWFKSFAQRDNAVQTLLRCRSEFFSLNTPLNGVSLLGSRLETVIGAMSDFIKLDEALIDSLI